MFSGQNKSVRFVVIHSLHGRVCVVHGSCQPALVPARPWASRSESG